ncbi:hypothetical protein RCL1_003622 [Eukaryota sp. TZLM3-RCL]
MSQLSLEQRLVRIEEVLDTSSGQILTTALNAGITSARLLWMPSDYYSKPLKERARLLKAPSIKNLCKTLIMVNTRCIYDDCSIASNSKYYAVIVQYCEKLNSSMFHEFLKSLPGNESLTTVKHFNLRLLDNAEAENLFGFEYNSVPPIGLKLNNQTVPIILAQSIVDLNSLFYTGAGNVDCKLVMSVREFVDKMKPLIANITVSK